MDTQRIGFSLLTTFFPPLSFHYRTSLYARRRADAAWAWRWAGLWRLLRATTIVLGCSFRLEAVA